LQDFADRNLRFTRMTTGLKGSVAKEMVTEKAKMVAKLMVN
jgi:hypothetical protein